MEKGDADWDGLSAAVFCTTASGGHKSIWRPVRSLAKPKNNCISIRNKPKIIIVPTCYTEYEYSG